MTSSRSATPTPPPPPLPPLPPAGPAPGQVQAPAPGMLYRLPGGDDGTGAVFLLADYTGSGGDLRLALYTLDEWEYLLGPDYGFSDDGRFVCVQGAPVCTIEELEPLAQLDVIPFGATDRPADPGEEIAYWVGGIWDVYGRILYDTGPQETNGDCWQLLLAWLAYRYAGLRKRLPDRLRG